MLGLIILVGFLQSWSMALSILCLCLISAVMTMGANIQWGYAGLINFGIMGYTALGGLAAVLVSVPPVREAWQVGGFNMILCAFLIVLMVFSIRFIMKKYNYIASARRTLKIESESISAIGKQLNQSFINLCENVISTKGKSVIMGVGKSGHIAQKISATLTSTGTPSIFIHPTEAAHGDMGLIGKKDIVLLISNSGETDEIINILPSLKRHAKEISSLTSNNNSTIAKSADIKIELKSEKEACPLDLAPTSSTTNALAFGDALAIALLEAKGFTKNDFASSHPAGKLGKKLITQVQDIMHKGSSVPKVSPNTVLDKALIEITKKNLGITLVIDKAKVVGIFTDGDLRRCINKKIDIQKTKIKEVMTKSYKTIKSNALAVDAALVMEKNKILTLIVVENKKHVGVISMHDLIEARIL